MDGRYRGRLVGVAVVAAMSVVLVLPAAADLSLMAGDPAEVAYTDGDGVNLRDAPSLNAAVLTALPEAFAVTIDEGPVIIADGSSWYAVTAETSAGSVSGWVSATYLSGIIDTGVPDELNFSDAAARGVPVYPSLGGDWLNLRVGPSLASEVTAAIPDGAPVEVLAPMIVDEEGIAWSLVRYAEIVGYSAASYLGGFATEDGGASNGLMAVTGTGGDGLSLREGPGIAATRLSVLPEGAEVWLLDGPVSDAAGDAWYQVEADGLSGWVHGAYLAAAGSGASATGAAIVEASLGYLNVPYLWAGTTPAGFDCSGFTWFIVSTVADSEFPRPNEDQVLYGSEVARDSLAPGDLIFFQNTYQWGLSHVGIYLGDGQFISASGEHDAVGISSLGDPYWSTRYLTARRVG